MDDMQVGGEPRAEWADDCCVVCPGQSLGPGTFDVVDRPARRYAFDAAVGYRVDQLTGTPVCVHPFRVGLPAGRYASAGEPVPETAAPAIRAVFTPSPEQLALPGQVEDLEGWLIAMLRTARADAMASALARSPERGKQTAA